MLIKEGPRLLAPIGWYLCAQCVVLVWSAGDSFFEQMQEAAPTTLYISEPIPRVRPRAGPRRRERGARDLGKTPPFNHAFNCGPHAPIFTS